MRPGRSATMDSAGDRTHVCGHLFSNAERTGSCWCASVRTSRRPDAQGTDDRRLQADSFSGRPDITDSDGFKATFEIDPFRKFCLVEGLDDIGLTYGMKQLWTN